MRFCLAWIVPAWLVFDRRGTGSITSGLQLFGSVTFWLFWENGYDALRSLDDNGDGAIAGADRHRLGAQRDQVGQRLGKQVDALLAGHASDETDQRLARDAGQVELGAQRQAVVEAAEHVDPAEVGPPRDPSRRGAGGDVGMAAISTPVISPILSRIRNRVSPASAPQSEASAAMESRAPCSRSVVPSANRHDQVNDSG